MPRQKTPKANSRNAVYTGSPKYATRSYNRKKISAGQTLISDFFTERAQEEHTPQNQSNGMTDILLEVSRETTLDKPLPTPIISNQMFNINNFKQPLSEDNLSAPIRNRGRPKLFKPTLKSNKKLTKGKNLAENVLSSEVEESEMSLFNSNLKNIENIHPSVVHSNIPVGKTFLLESPKQNSIKFSNEGREKKKNDKPQKKTHYKTQKPGKKKLLLPHSDSFEEFGIITPSYEKILTNIDKMKNEAKALEVYEKLCENLDLSSSTPLKYLHSCDTSKDEHIELLDCKHLSREELKKHFYNDLEFVRNIFDGVTISERHLRYKNYDTKFNLTMRDLTYSSSTIVYTDDQKCYLLKLLEKKLDPEDMLTDYFFKVLLPELCLKIFMDVHEMTTEEATAYLDWRPVD